MGSAPAAAFPGQLSGQCRLGQDFAVVDQTGVDAKLVRFAGCVRRQLADKLDNTLIVHQVSADGTAPGYYAWGTYRRWSIKEPDCLPFTGEIADGQLKFRLPWGSRVTYRLIGTQTLEASFNQSGRFTRGVMHRQ
ncbi:MAG: hypothetical protein AAF441_16690 [Pseudomonadota bacterium]